MRQRGEVFDAGGLERGEVAADLVVEFGHTAPRDLVLLARRASEGSKSGWATPMGGDEAVNSHRRRRHGFAPVACASG